MGVGALIAALAGGAVIAGVFVIVAGIRGTEFDPAAPPRPSGLARALAAIGLSRQSSLGRRWQLWVAAAVFILVFLATHLLLSAALLTSFIWVLPWLMAPTRSDKTFIVRLEALEEWTRRLAAMAQIGAGLEQSLHDSLPTAPTSIKPAIADLVARLDSKMALRDALMYFADDLAMVGGDTVVLALVAASADRGPGLTATLNSLADSLSEDSAMRREVEAKRGESRTTVRYLTLTLVAVVGVGALDTGYVRPYQSPVGIAVLAGCLAALFGTFWWMRSLIQGPPEPRILLQKDGR
ncbi:type II secretion system F family protein [Catenulispora sp. NL8]|uniref:Type II secretion system F family protein n=1 Tax=Catenulispora pinistramenti TaxID=2705254 RepID=A0ABS5KIT1_9ACTN|nr:type II secretion system F family protein [Catenulispora pinistramenti]MBS2545374.1 type II secretion system F family protein [Catenulispora pinistramenti]